MAPRSNKAGIRYQLSTTRVLTAKPGETRETDSGLISRGIIHETGADLSSSFGICLRRAET